MVSLVRAPLLMSVRYERSFLSSRIKSGAGNQTLPRVTGITEIGLRLGGAGLMTKAMRRRHFLLAAGVGLPLLGIGRLVCAEPTPPACGLPTPRQTEGPYFTPKAPLKRDLREAGMAGEALRLQGVVLDKQCRPLPGAMLEFWQADAAGAYDNAGFRLRGHVMANADGAWRIDSILPGAYPGRTRHIHVKVYAEPKARPLTT